MQLASDARTVHGRYAASILTPRAECVQQFLAPWTARNAAIDDRAKIELEVERAIKRAGVGHNWLAAILGRAKAQRSFLNDAAAELRHIDYRIREFTRQMSPLQFVRFMDSFPNLVTTVGKNDILDKYLKGSAYTQTLVMGLCGTGTKAAGDTQASHGGWSEVGGTNAPAFTGNRPAITMGSASSQVSTSPTQAFAITSSGNVDGCFINNGGSATKDNTTGVLFSAGDFTGGSQAVNNLDTLNAVYTLTAS